MVNLNPAGFAFSNAYGTNGLQQVGDAGTGVSGSGPQAMLWSGTAATATNLGSLLPANIVGSRAFTIDSSGEVFGWGYDASFNQYAIEWAPVPEPTTFSVLGIGAALLLCRRKLSR